MVQGQLLVEVEEQCWPPQPELPQKYQSTYTGREAWTTNSELGAFVWEKHLHKVEDHSLKMAVPCDGTKWSNPYFIRGGHSVLIHHISIVLLQTVTLLASSKQEAINKMKYLLTIMLVPQAVTGNWYIAKEGVDSTGLQGGLFPPSRWTESRLSRGSVTSLATTTTNWPSLIHWTVTGTKGTRTG